MVPTRLNFIGVVRLTCIPAILLLAACGGETGGGTTPTPDPDIVVDVTPDVPPGVGETCGPDDLCAEGLECVDDTCEEPSAKPDASPEDVAEADVPDSVGPLDDGSTPEEDVSPDITQGDDAEAPPDADVPEEEDTTDPPVCAPDCEDKACGDDGCGGVCGACDDGLFCNAGACEETCTSDAACSEDGETLCNEADTGVRTCTEVTDGCIQLTATTMCAEDEVCKNGACQVVIVDGCTEPSDCVEAFDTVPACQVPTCEVATGACILASLADETPCDDANPCSYNDTCADGACSGVGGDCDDANECTDDECTDTGCEHDPKVGLCDDNNLCTIDDFCIAGTCMGDAMNCSDAPEDECLENGELRHYEEAGLCDPNAGLCVYEYLDIQCSEGCYEGACASDKCQVELPGTKCDDGLACTEDDSCTIDQTCQGIPVDCSSFADLCLEAACDVEDGTCKTLPLTDGTACDDADACTINDQCMAGECVLGSLTPCDDQNPCTDDACDPVSGECTHVPNTGTCDDDDACTVDDACSGGFCFGSPKDCSDGDQCTDDICTTDGTCVNPIQGGDCDDGDPCTVNDECNAGLCSGEDYLCDDGNPCTEDACVGEEGCVVLGDADIEIPCFGSDAELAGTGICTEGTRTCSGGVLGPCAGQVLPVEEICGNLLDDNCDGWVDEPQCTEPPVGLTDAMLEWSLTSGSPGMLVGQWADLNNGAYQQTLGGLVTQPPGTQGTIEVHAGPLSAQAYFSTEAYPPAWVEGHIRNPEVYVDEPVVRAVALVRDAVGRPYVSAGKVDLRLMLIGQDDLVTSCFVGPNSTCEIAADIPESWFSGDIPTSVVARFELPGGASTGQSTVTLVKTPPIEELPDPGFVATLPHGPQHVGRSFTVPIYAVASSAIIESFDVSIPFDPTVLSVQSVTIDPRYNGVHNPKYDEILIVGVRESDTPLDEAIGQVHLADIQFRVRDDATEGASVQFAPEVASLYDLQNVPLTGADGSYTVHIQSGSAADSVGYIEVAENPVRGIYAVATSNELVNTSGIFAAGEPVTSPVHVHAVRAYAPDENVAADADCTSEFTANVKFTGDCLATLDDTTTSPTSAVEATVTYGEHVATLPFRVWQPIYPVSVTVEDNFLERITGVLDEACEAERYQETEAHVDVSFRYTPTGTEIMTGRLDEHVTFAAGDSPGEISVDGNVIRGQAIGQAEVLVLGPQGEIGSTAVIVSGTPTAVTGIDVVAPTAIVMDAFNPPPPLLHVGTALAQATLVQSFDFEGKEGPILAYATFEDNKRMEITPESGLVVTSLAPTAVSIEQDPLRAVSLSSGEGDMLDARWVVCDEEVGSGVGHLEMNLPNPVGAEITLSANALARAPNDAAALAGLPNCATVQVTLEYETGQTKDFTLDERTLYDDAGGDPFDLFELQTIEAPNGEVTGIQVCSTASENHGAFALLVSFTHAPDLGENDLNDDGALDFIVPVNIVQADSLSLDARPWPAYPGSDGLSKTVFNQIEATGQYQRGVLDAALHLSDGSVVDVSTNPSSSFSLVPASSVFSITQPNLVSATGPGSAQVSVSFGDQTSSDLGLIATETGVQVSSLAVDFPVTFKGVADLKTDVVEVTATFDDGSVMADAQDVPGLLTYDTSHPDAMTIDAWGTATLHANHRENVSVTVTTATSGTQQSVWTACNLDPAVGDVDLGQVFGIAHPDVLPGEDFVMPVRVNTGNQSIGALDVTFEYNPDIIQAVSGEPGGGWPGGQLEITLNDPPGEVHIVAAATAGANAGGNALEVARINFQGLKSEETNLTLIQGHIRKLLANSAEQSPIGEELVEGALRDIVAGHGWLDPDCVGGLDPSEIVGNADGDCEFSVADVSYGLHYLAELIEPDSVTGFQLVELDADRNGTVDVADVVYLIRVLAGKFRFATLSVAETGGLTDPTTLEVTLRDASGAPYGDQATVWLDLATTENTSMTLLTGTYVTPTEDGLVVEAENVGGGVYRVSATDFTQAEDIGVALVIRTVDGLGETADDRAVALHGSPWLSPGSQHVPFATVNFGGNAAPLCLPGECNDGNPCTDDACDTEVGCVFTPNTVGCDDEDECTEADQCSGGECVGIAIPGCGEETYCGNDVCEEGEDCSNCFWDCGECPPVEECGDGSCNGAEDCEDCPQDCGVCEGDCCTANGSPGCENQFVTACVCAIDPYCCAGTWEANCATKAVIDCSTQCEGPGNGICEDGENCLNSQGDCDCSCGDTLCTADEDCGNCPADCGECPPTCGDGECNGDEVCDVCIEDCGECDPFCGDDTCDVELMGTCSDNPAVACKEASDCPTAAATCDGYYQQEGCCAECQECPADCGGACGPYCGDGTCHLSNDESCLNCELDCGACGGDCCVTHDGTGCDGSVHATFTAAEATTLSECVCEHQPECCTIGWNEACLMAAVAECETPCPYCGDDTCQAEYGEDMETCAVDCCPDGICPEYCGNGTCAPKLIGTCADGADPPQYCVSDDECSAGIVCEGFDEGESCLSCADDCGECSQGSCCEDGTAACEAGGDCGGCSEPDVMTCVCETMGLSSCCSSGGWTDICVQMAFSSCAPACSVVCGDGMCTSGTQDVPETLGICDDGADPPNYCSDTTLCEGGEACEGYVPGQPGQVIEDCSTCAADCGECVTECGNDVCEAGETCETCQDDCGPCIDCGDGLCDWPENCTICVEDCGACSATCDDEVCQIGENAQNCPGDCPGVICGDDVCIGVLDETTEPIGTTGNTLLQENAENCPADCMAYCGDGLCTAGEDCTFCEEDCGECPAAFCGDGVCAGSDYGEGCAGCNEDCSALCIDVCTIFGFPVCEGACDPLGSPTGCGSNLSCVPSITTVEDPPDIPGGSWYMTVVETIGNGVCGMGAGGASAFVNGACSDHDDCCVEDSGSGATLCGASEGYGCLKVSGLDQPGLCGTVCNAETGTGCQGGDVCELSEAGAGVIGICVPGGALCDPSSPVASGCTDDGGYNACLALRDETNVGACLQGCYAKDPYACDGVPAGDSGDTISCHARTEDRFREGTCIGTGGAGCDLTAADPCAPGGNDRCNVFGGGFLAGYSLYCTGPAGTAGTGQSCVEDDDCQPAHLCFDDKCRAGCSATVPCAGGTTCTGIGALLGGDPDGVSLCLP